MSNANKIGRVDRRVKTPGTVVSSNDGFKRVYGDLYLPSAAHSQRWKGMIRMWFPRVRWR